MEWLKVPGYRFQIRKCWAGYWGQAFTPEGEELRTERFTGLGSKGQAEAAIMRQVQQREMAREDKGE
jgi:hypothetical protein